MVVAGLERKAHFFAMDLPHSDACFLKAYPAETGEVEAAVREVLRLGAIGFDAVKHLVLCRIERRPPRLDLDVYPYLPKAHVETTSAKSYMSLIGGSRP